MLCLKNKESQIVCVCVCVSSFYKDNPLILIFNMIGSSDLLLISLAGKVPSKA